MNASSGVSAECTGPAAGSQARRAGEKNADGPEPNPRGQAMRIAYYTLDEVNRFLVRRWAHDAGARLVCPDGPRLNDECPGTTALLLDLDHLPADVREAWLRRVLAGETGMPVLVHGHNIADAEAMALRARGAHVCRGRVRRAALHGWLAGQTVQGLRLESRL
jgi:hypothetical protein